MTTFAGVREDWKEILAPSRRFDEWGSSILTFPISDTFEGVVSDPQSLHKYLYAHGDPVNNIDPTGMYSGAAAGAIRTAITLQLFAYQDPAVMLNHAIEDQRQRKEDLENYHARLKLIEEKYNGKWPALYKAVGFSEFFPKLREVARKQVAGVYTDWSRESGAIYSVTFNNIGFSWKANSVADKTIVHESVHAWDDYEGWYLHSTYPFHLRESEALGYGAEYSLYLFDELVRLRSRLDQVNRGELSRNDWQQQWDRFWRPFRTANGVHEENVHAYDVSKLTNADFADIKKRLGIEFNYSKIAPLFGLPPEHP